MATVNWSEMDNAADEATKPAPAGRYVLEVKKVEEGESKQGHHPQIIVTWAVAEGPYKGKVVKDYLTLNREKPITIDIARNGLKMIGFKDLATWGNIDPQQRLQMPVGKRIEAELEVNEYQGRLGNRIKQKIKAISGGGTGGSPDGIAPPPPKTDDVPAAAKPVNPLSGI